jgi:hypothetical protein
MKIYGKNWCSYPESKKEIPAILADDGISKRRASAGFFADPFAMIQKFQMFDNPLPL